MADILAQSLADLAASQPVGATGKNSLTVGGGQEPVAYLDLGEGGYMDVGTDLSDEELAALPKGRHMLGIIGTYGVDGYKPAQAVDLGQSIPSELAPVAAALKRFDECAEDCGSDGSDGCDIGRAWFDALTTMGLLKRTQRSPAVWTMTEEGERLMALIDSKAAPHG